jgi:hypothetical protein
MVAVGVVAAEAEAEVVHRIGERELDFELSFIFIIRKYKLIVIYCKKVNSCEDSVFVLSISVQLGSRLR